MDKDLLQIFILIFLLAEVAGFFERLHRHFKKWKVWKEKELIDGRWLL